MSSEARTKQIIDDAVRAAVEPLERAVDALSARLAAVEGERGASDAGAQERPSRGRTAKARTAQADTSAEDAAPSKDGEAK
jgi:hypothetical protein